jgi:prepilin-type processing-associated H-X9-DG protein
MDPKADITLDELVKGINNKEGRVGSFHPGGANTALFDGSVRFLSNSIPKETLKALGTCNGGERVTLDGLR